ncbi:MAG: hypothetical protein R3266_00645 [Gemmatimonadota bacterium]|nr:hypothetical protein [Gemmatimonadota bacterium]
MLSVYLTSLFVGGGLAVLSATGDLVDDPGGVAGPGRPGSEAPGVGRAAARFSVRSFLYSLTGFGATGALLTLLGTGPGRALTLAFAVLAGLAVGGGLGSLIAYVKRLSRRS